jgi:hypothetical protein
MRRWRASLNDETPPASGYTVNRSEAAEPIIRLGGGPTLVRGASRVLTLLRALRACRADGGYRADLMPLNRAVLEGAVRVDAARAKRRHHAVMAPDTAHDRCAHLLTVGWISRGRRRAAHANSRGRYKTPDEATPCRPHGLIVPRGGGRNRPVIRVGGGPIACVWGLPPRTMPRGRGESSSSLLYSAALPRLRFTVAVKWSD